MSKKLTITDILAQKEAAKQNQKKLSRQVLHVKSLDAEITVQEPTKALVMEAAKLEDQTLSDAHIVYHCTVEPDLKGNHRQLMEHYGCATPYEIVDCLFKPGEVSEIALLIMGLAGYSTKNTGVKIVGELKN